MIITPAIQVDSPSTDQLTGLTPEQALINHCEVCGPQFDRLEGNRCERHKSV